MLKACLFSITFVFMAIFCGCNAQHNVARVSTEAKQQKTVTYAVIETPTNQVGPNLTHDKKARQQTLNRKLHHLHTLLTLSVLKFEDLEQEKLYSKQSQFVGKLTFSDRQYTSREKIAAFRRRQAEIMTTANKVVENATDNNYESVIKSLDDYINIVITGDVTS